MSDSAAPEPRRSSQVSARTTLRLRWQQAKRDVYNRLTWSRLYRAASYARSALWIVPFVAILVVLIVVPLIRVVDSALGWQFFGLSPKGAETLYQTVTTLTLSFMVFTFGSMLVAIQVAGGQLTPLIIATTLLRDNVVRYTVGLFVFTLMFATMALNRTDGDAHDLVAFLAAVLGVVCMVAFLFLIDYSARLLRPVSILARVGDQGVEVIKHVYPMSVDQGDDKPDVPPALPDSPRRVVINTGRSQIALAVDLEALTRGARRARGVIEFAPRVGDFVSAGDPLFVLYGGATAIDDHRLRTTVALGPERTIEQDPLFAFRILVDIALKALSPAINDPTTAVCALDQIHRLLRVVGGRQLRGDVIVDGLGHARVIYRRPDWDDFVNISCNEIRASGAGQVQVARRMRAMFDNLIATLPPYRAAALRGERDRLDEVLQTHFTIPADLALARLPDTQGLGGTTK